MIRTYVLLPTFMWIQAITQTPVGGVEGFMERYGMPGIALGIIVALWREDRKARIENQKELDQRYATLVEASMKIATSNTSAMTALNDTLRGTVTTCPWSGTRFSRRFLERLIAEASEGEEAEGGQKSRFA